MPLSFVQVLDAYEMPALVQREILLRTEILARTLGATEVALVAEAGLPDVRHALEVRRRRGVDRRHDPESAAQLDLQIDRRLSALHRALRDLLKQPEANAARRLLEAAFPAGLKAHVHAPHVALSALNHHVLQVLTDEEHRALLSIPHLADLVAPLADLIPRFDAALAAEAELSTAALHAAERAGEDAVMRLVCKIIIHGAKDDPSAEALREQLLQPYLEAQARLGQLAARRRAGGAGR